MQPAGFDILYEEGPCLVLNKPGGLPTQAPPGIDSLEVRIKEFLRVREAKPGKVYLGVPHRLDRPVSGALVVAKHVRAARRLSEQFEGRMVEKIYWAVVEGEVLPDQGTWTDRVGKIPNEPRAILVDQDHPESKSAVLSYRVLGRQAGRSWLEIILETGRYHQIRVQTSARGFPILGDDLYGSTQPFGMPTEESRQRVIALHAWQLGFQHPMTRDKVRLNAPVPNAWHDITFDFQRATSLEVDHEQ